MLEHAGDVLTRVVVCCPHREYARTSDLAGHNMAEAPDQQTALAQHAALQALLRAQGCEVIGLAELEDHPNAVFTMDPVCSTPRGFVQLRMGLASRRGEETWLASALADLGEPCAGQIQAPGMAEGGDVLFAGTVVFVGQSTRSDLRGIDQLRALIEPMGCALRVATVPPPFLHLGGAMTVVGRELVLCCKGLFSKDLLRGFEAIEIDTAGFASGNVIALGNKRAIVEARNSAAQNALAKHGFTVLTLDLSEFVKGNGGPSCLIMPLQRTIWARRDASTL